jgi:hypothetical protein
MTCWGDTRFNYRRSITIDHSLISADLTDYPMLVKLTDSSLRDGANGGNVVDSNGYDIMFYDESCNLLSHELVYYDNTIGAIVMYVKVPLVMSDRDTVIYMYYGSDEITSDQSTTATWNSNYVMVQHLHQANLAGLLDSTSNDNDAVAEQNTPDYQQGGKIHQSVYIGNVEFIHFGDDSSLRPEYVTIEAWLHASTFGATAAQMPYDDGAPWDAPWAGYGLHKTGVQKFYFQGNEDGTYRSITDDVVRSLATWYHVVGKYDGNYFYLYVNGVKTQSTPTDWDGVITYNGTPNFVLGCHSTHNAGEYWRGRIEEVRISNVARSDAYVEASYENENDFATFASVGGEETPGFHIIGESYDIEFGDCNPSWGDGEENAINKKIDTFEFWSDNYEVYDDGIDTQPLTLRGTITMTDGEYAFCTPWCMPFCADTWFYDKFKHIWLMQDNHEEVEITGLGDCFNAVYVIKDFNFNTVPRHGKHFLKWQMSLEKVRDS